MAFERIANNLKRIKSSFLSFGEVSAEYYKLLIFEKGMKAGIGLVNGLIMAFFILFFIVFLSFAVSFWLSNLIGVPSSGFFIVAGFYLLLFCCMLLFGNKLIERTLLVKISRKVFNDSDPDGEPNEERDETV